MAYTSQYPPAYDSDHCKSNDAYGGRFFAYLTFNPALSNTGTHEGPDNSWYGTNTNLPFSLQVDLGAGFVIRNFKYVNGHYITTSTGIGSFTFWGSNSSSAFADTDPTHDTDWTQLTTEISTLTDNGAADDGSFANSTVTNSTSYQYYRFKFTTKNDGNAQGYSGTRRIELQTEDGWSANTLPDTPTNVTPADEATGISRRPVLEASEFSDDDVGDTHAASQWLVATDSGFTDIVWDSGEDAVNLETTTVNATNGTFGGTRAGKTRLAGGTVQYWKVRYKDSAGGWSLYS
jgi:hypothetical protein